MKTLFFLTMIMIASCSHIPAKNNLNINELKVAMSYGTMRQLNDIDPDIEKDLLVRLYQVPIMDGNCFIETHGICQNKYYLSVSTFDEFPETNIFRLNMVGEVSGVHWLQEDITDHVKIEFTFNKYTKEALKNNRSLVNFQSKILVELDPNTLEEIAR